jgi:hypothetical protein
MDWGLKPGAVENFDRSRIFKPHTGATPPAGATYAWKLKWLKLVDGTANKLPQLRGGFELYPRNKAEEKYAGFFQSTYSPVSDKTDFRYVPFLDCFGITEREFLRGTKHDEKGNIYQIGKWKFNPAREEVIVLAQLKTEDDQQGNPRLVLSDGWFGIYDPDNDPLAEEDEDEEEYDDDEEYDDEEEGEDEEDDDDWV